jgi:predicted DCC family thiol-disulfide oxidoreductase YuxK
MLNKSFHGEVAMITVLTVLLIGWMAIVLLNQLVRPVSRSVVTSITKARRQLANQSDKIFPL